MAYTDAMVATLRKAEPINLAKAQALASELGVSYRSVISKAKQLGIEYQAKAPAAKKQVATGPTKAQILAEIRSKLGMPERDSELTKAELSKVLDAL